MEAKWRIQKTPLWRKGVKMDIEEMEINFEQVQIQNLEKGFVARWIGKCELVRNFKCLVAFKILMVIR